MGNYYTNSTGWNVHVYRYMDREDTCTHVMSNASSGIKCYHYGRPLAVARRPVFSGMITLSSILQDYVSNCQPIAIHT